MGDVYMLNGKILSGLPNHAKDIEFDNTGTTLSSTNTEDAIKEVNSNLSDLKMKIITGGVDFNTLDKTGVYNIGASASNINAPIVDAGTGWLLLTFGSGWAGQFAISYYADTTLYFRKYGSTGWQAWKTI